MQTWDMMQALRCRNGARGLIPIEVPGIGPYECADGWVYGYVGAPGGAAWTDLLQWMIDEGKAEDLVEDNYREFIGQLNLRFLTTFFADPATLGQKMMNLQHINEVLRRFIKSMGKWEMYEGGQGRRLLFGIVATPEDIVNNPQLKYRNWITAVEHPELNDTLRYPGPPYRLSATPWAIRRRPPLPGEHNDEVFCGNLGVTREQLQALRAAGAV